MELNLKTWNGLEPICEIENSLFRTMIPKQKWKLLNVVIPKVLILGPLFFLTFVNDLNNLSKVLDPVPFADDTSLFCSDDNIRTLFESANQKLNQINDCFLANKLSLYVEKTK